MKQYEESVKVTREALLASVGVAIPPSPRPLASFIADWLSIYPGDRAHLDLEQMVKAGLVETPRGSGNFLPFNEWRYFLKSKGRE